MKRLRNAKLMFVFLLLIGGVGAYAYFTNRLTISQLSNLPLQLPQLNQQTVNDLPAQVSQKASNMAQQGQELSQQAGAVLGQAVEKNEDAPIPQRAAEYARYLYCQEVVRNYETAQ